MKKIITVIICMLLCLSLFVGLVACNDAPADDKGADTSAATDKAADETPYTINVMAPAGAPALALGHLSTANKTFGQGTVEFSVGTGDSVKAALISGTADFAIFPTSGGAQLAIKQGKYQLLATTSWGNLYIVTTDSAIATLADCADTQAFMAQFAAKNIDTIGGGNVDAALQYLFDRAGVEMEMQSYTDGDTIIPRLKKGDSQYAMLGEPAVTVASQKITGLRVLAKVSDIWKEYTGTDFPQASLFVRKDFAAAHPDVVTAFAAAVEQSVDYYNASASAAVEVATTVGLSETVIGVIGECYPRTAQRYVEAKDAKASVLKFLEVLNVQVDSAAADAIFYN